MRTFGNTVVWGGLLAGVTMGVGASDAAINGANRSYASGKYELVMNGVDQGFVTSVAGGSAYQDVVTEKAGSDVKKRIGGVKYEAISIECGTGMSKGFYLWIADALAQRYTRQSGAIQSMDFSGNVVSELQFRNAILAEIGFPALDASSKDAAKLTVTFAPELTKSVTVNPPTKIATREWAAAQKRWSSSSFRVTIPGLDTTTVNKVDALVFKQKVASTGAGDLRDYQAVPSGMSVPNLALTLAESKADSWYKWHQDFVIRGNNGDANEKNATIEYLAQDSKPLFTLSLRHVGIFSLTPEKVEAGSENIRRIKAEMYVEEASFSFDNAAVP